MFDLQQARDRIQNVDQKIFDLLLERATEVRAIGEYKKSAGLPIFDPQREQEIYDWLDQQAQAQGLPAAELKNIWNAIIAYAHQLESEVE